MFPNFLCIGAQRSGTSWLNKNLRQHPAVWMPPIKEIHYFDEREKYAAISPVKSFIYTYRLYKRRLRWVSKSVKRKVKSQSLNWQALNWYRRYLLGSRCDQWYSSLFDLGMGKTIGEITPEYGPLNPESVAHIYEIMPDAKIIFIMRNPIQRAWSHLLMELRNDKIPLESLSKEAFIEHFNSKKSIKKSSYSHIVETWKSYYPEEQLFIAFFEEIKDCPEDLLLRIFDFIGVESSPKFISAEKSSKKQNAST